MVTRNICLLIADITRSGGTERAVVNLANDLSSLGNNVIVVSIFSNKGNAFYDMAENIHIEHLHVYFQPNLVKRIFVGFKQLYTSLNALYKSKNETIFVATDPFVSFVMAQVHNSRRGNALVVCEHMALSISKIYSVWFRKLFFRRVDAVVVLTGRDLEFVRQILPQVKSAVIPNRLSFVPEIFSDCQSKVILSVGRLEAQKNYGELIKICEPILKEYPDWSLVIVGGGSQEHALKGLIEKTALADQIQIVGPTRQIADYFLRSSIYVMSSIYEGFPMVLLEAKTYGLPIVSFDCPNGPREMINGGMDGFLIKMHDHIGLRDALKLLMDNPMLRMEYGKKGSEDVRRRYSKDDIIVKWQNLLEDI